MHVWEDTAEDEHRGGVRGLAIGDPDGGLAAAGDSSAWVTKAAKGPAGTVPGRASATMAGQGESTPVAARLFVASPCL